LLDEAGLDFDVWPVDIDETPRPDEPAEEYVARLAEAKARAAAREVPGRPVLGADTVVVIDGQVLGKPVDARDAVAMLRRLSGRAHDVLTGVALVWGERCANRVERTRVIFRALTDAEIAAYVASGEPADKAGGYAIQGRAGAFVTELEGSHSNVVGLPVAAVLQLVGELTPDPADPDTG
jgi:septum formation protein